MNYACSPFNLQKLSFNEKIRLYEEEYKKHTFNK